MISQLAATGVRVPGGFATTAHAFREFLQHDGLAERIDARLATLTPTTCARWPRPAPRSAHWIESTPFPADAGSGDPRRVRAR